MTTEETVSYYFELWNARDNAGMNSVVYEKMHYAEDFSGFISVELKGCKELQNRELIDEDYESWA